MKIDAYVLGMSPLSYAHTVVPIANARLNR